jgi:hypothetical protein
MRAFTRIVPFAALLSLALAVASQIDCTTLPAIEAGTCGNAVVDPGEDCDTFAPPGERCRPPSNPKGCRFDCTQGAGDQCPAGWGCGNDGICRQSSGSYKQIGDPVPAGAWRVALGNFDGNGGKEVLTREAVDDRGLSNIRIHAFAADGTLQSTLIPGLPFGDPNIADVNSDGLDDLTALYSNFRQNSIAVLLGQSDGTLSPVAYPALSIPVSVLLVTIPEITVSEVFGAPGLAGITSVGSMPAFFGYIDEVRDKFFPIMQLPGATSQMTGDPMSSPLFSGEPCRQIVYGYDTGANPSLPAVSILSPCTIAAGLVTWALPPATPKIRTISLPQGVVTDTRGVRIADMNGDGNLDILIGGVTAADDETYVAYGDGVGGFFGDLGDPVNTASKAEGPWMPPGLDLKTFPLPLAVGELSGDAYADFVLDQEILTSRVVGFVAADAGAEAGDGGADAGAPVVTYFVSASKPATAWTVARIADFNHDGNPDVVAGNSAELNLAFFNGTGTNVLYPFSIPTTGGVSHFAVADYDGDLVKDLAFSQTDFTPGAGDDVAIAYGRAQGAPDTPITIGRFGSVQQNVPLLPLTDLVVVSSPNGGPDGGAPGAGPTLPDGGSTSLTNISILASGGDRQPLAGFGLSYNADPNNPMTTRRWDAVGLTLAQASKGSPTLFALGHEIVATGAASGFNLFQLGVSAGATLTMGSPSPALMSAAPSGQTATSRTALLMATGDIDGDGTVEVVAVAPDAIDDKAAHLLAFKPSADGSVTLMGDSKVALPIYEQGQVGLADINGDGLLDVIVLSGTTGSVARVLEVVPNDPKSKGSFAAGAAAPIIVQLGAVGGVPQGFTLLRLLTGPPVLAFVTSNTIMAAHLDPSGTTLTASALEIDTSQLDGGSYRPSQMTGIVAGDIDGDGVDDMAIADHGNLVLFHGLPVLQ